MAQGHARNVNHNCYEYRLFSLIVLGAGQFSTKVEQLIARQIHPPSPAFAEQQLEPILSRTSPQLSAFLRNEIARDPSMPRTVDFEGKVAFSVRAPWRTSTRWT
jgi:hypothetical protein